MPLDEIRVDAKFAQLLFQCIGDDVVRSCRQKGRPASLQRDRNRDVQLTAAECRIELPGEYLPQPVIALGRQPQHHFAKRHDAHRVIPQVPQVSVYAAGGTP